MRSFASRHESEHILGNVRERSVPYIVEQSSKPEDSLLMLWQLEFRCDPARYMHYPYRVFEPRV